MVTLAMSRTDFAVIPTKGSELDAIEAIKVIKFIRVQERVFRRTIPYAVLFTQTNPAVRPRTLKSLEADMLQQGVPMFDTALNERDAFRAIFSYGGTLSGLDTNAVGNMPPPSTTPASSRRNSSLSCGSSSQQPNGKRRRYNVRIPPEHLQQHRCQ